MRAATPAGHPLPLNDPLAIRRAGRDLLSLALLDSRNHLLRTLALDESAAALRTAARAGAYQEYWVSRHVQRQRGPGCDPRGPRLAGIEPALDAWLANAGPTGPTGPTPAALRAYLAETLDITLDLLAAVPADGADDDTALHFYRLSLLHEDRLAESLAARLSVGPPIVSAPARAERAALWLPAQRWVLGTPDASPRGLLPHNERGALDAAVPEFEIDAVPVNWARFVEFAEDGGYDRAEWWSAAGWAWVQASGRRAPGHVAQWRGGVVVQRQAGLQRAAATQTAQHVSRHEAEAWCRWAGRRLPTEPEWEIAAHAARGRGWAAGEVFEWVAGSARAWPGAGPPSPGCLDAPPAAGAALGVLRGASHATRLRWHHPKARRFAAPERDDLFCGFRTCAV